MKKEQIQRTNSPNLLSYHPANSHSRNLRIETETSQNFSPMRKYRSGMNSPKISGFGNSEIGGYSSSNKYSVYPANTQNLNYGQLNSPKNYNSIGQHLNKQSYLEIKAKINHLEDKLNNFKHNYQQSLLRNNCLPNHTTNPNKQNQNKNPKERECNDKSKSKSKLLLENYKKNHSGHRKDSTSLKNAVTQKALDALNKTSSGSQNTHSQKQIHQTQHHTQQNTPHHIQTQTIQKKPRIIKGTISQQQKPPKPKQGLTPKREDGGKAKLEDYVTTFKCQAEPKLSQSVSEINIIKPQMRSKPACKYYIPAVVNAFATPKPTLFDALCKEHLRASLDILNFIKMSNKKFDPPKRKRALTPASKRTIIFDLDETLIHCNENISSPHDVALPIYFPNGSSIEAGINIRPHYRSCLKQLSEEYELMVFTASHQCYANVIINYLDPKGEFIKYRFFRDSCIKTEEGFYIKDLRIIDRDLKNCLLVDNAAYSYCLQLNNGVPIIPFYNNKADMELKHLTAYLKGLSSAKDLRACNAKEMKLSEYTCYKDPMTLISRLFYQ